MKNKNHIGNGTIIKLIICMLLFLFHLNLVVAYPMPTAVIGELSGDGSSNAYVYITAYNQEDGSTLYYNSLQTDSLGRFMDVISLDQSVEFMLVVQLLPQGANQEDDVATYSFSDLSVGDDLYVEHTFFLSDLQNEDDNGETESGSSSSSSSGGGSSGNTVGRVIEVPELDEIVESDTSSSPLSEEQEQELSDLIDAGANNVEKNNNNNVGQGSQDTTKINSAISNIIDKLVAPIEGADPVAIMLLSSMIMIFATIIILLVLPERYDSSEEEEKKAKLQEAKPFKERNLSLKGKSNFTGDLDSQVEVNDLKENDFVFVGGKKR